MALLRQLFLPHELRNERLVQLARVEEPSEDDLDAVLGLSGTSVHIGRFLREVTSPRWLQLFSDHGVLGGPGSDLWSTASSAAIRLAVTHRSEAESWLIASHDAHPSVVEHARCLAHAAQQIGGSALDLLLRIVWRFPEDDSVVHAGVDAAGGLDASHPMVQYLAYVLLGDDSWDHVMIADGLASRLAAGLNAQNALGRIGLLCHKLAGIPEDDYALGGLDYESSGLIAKAHTDFRHERPSVLLGSLTAMLRTAWEWHPPEALLEPAALLRPPLRDRRRAWVLASATEANPDALAAEVERAIIGRDATGDDVALVDRAIEVCGLAGVQDRWTEALGPAPSVIEVSQMLGADELPPSDWFRASSWEAVLPGEITTAWAAPCRVLAGGYGELTRDYLLQGSKVESYGFESPYTVEELNSMPPTQAAYKIARWRPDPGSFHVSARHLADALEEFIKLDPDRWLADALGIATALRHPVYIGRFLRAAEQCPDTAARHPRGLMDVIALISGEPWPAEDLRDRVLKNPSWRNAHAAAVGLIKALARAGADFGDRADELWAYIETAARDLSESPREPSNADRANSAVSSAINRLSTRAFEAVLVLTSEELRASKPLRPQLRELLDFALGLGGNDGADYRAILVPYLPWLRSLIPDWADANNEVIYGPAAPDDLGRLTLDISIRINRADKWLLETYPNEIRDAVVRGNPQALQHLLIGMLWRCPGYEPDSVAAFLQTDMNLVQQVASQLPNLLRKKNIEQSHLDTGMKLWRALLASPVAASLTEFGWMSQAENLDDDTWAELTLETLSATGGRIDWANQVAERAMKAPVTVTKILIVKEIVQAESDPWALRRVADRIEGFSDAAGDLRDSDEYSQLRTALQERGLID